MTSMGRPSMVDWLMSVVVARGRLWVYGVVAAAIFVPGSLLAWFAWYQLDEALTSKALERREAVALLTALTLKERLDRLIDVGESLATRVQFRNLIGRGEWEAAVPILQHVPDDLPYIEHILLVNPEGIVMADEPPLPGVLGLDFSHRDWYQGVTDDWEPYISRAYARLADPPSNVIAAAIPIKRPDGEVLGLLVMQVQLETLLDWPHAIDVGQGGFIYVVDQSGGLIAHPEFSIGDEIRDMSAEPAVQRGLRGEGGIMIESDNDRREPVVTSIQPVPGGYGWVVLVQQPLREAFALREATLNGVLLVYGVILFLGFCVAWLIASMLNALLAARSELERHADELAAVNRELEAFSYSVSHDLRAPLRAVDGFSRAVLEDYGAELPEKGRGYLERVSAGAVRMGQLIDDLLAFSHLSRAALKVKSVDMNALVREALDELQSEQAGRPVELHVEPLPSCEGDKMLLKQVWINLLSNALKYTRGRDPAVIEVDARKENGDTVYFVRDNGTGFDMRYAHKLFGVFQRLHRAEDFEGTGVGLAIVQRVIHRHGGTVWAESEPDCGAAFFFTVAGGTSHERNGSD